MREGGGEGEREEEDNITRKTCEKSREWQAGEIDLLVRVLQRTERPERCEDGINSLNSPPPPARPRYSSRPRPKLGVGRGAD